MGALVWFRDGSNLPKATVLGTEGKRSPWTGGQDRHMEKNSVRGRHRQVSGLERTQFTAVALASSLATIGKFLGPRKSGHHGQVASLKRSLTVEHPGPSRHKKGMKMSYTCSVAVSHVLYLLGDKYEANFSPVAGHTQEKSVAPEKHLGPDGTDLWEAGRDSPGRPPPRNGIKPLSHIQNLSSDHQPEVREQPDLFKATPTLLYESTSNLR
ncbi:hypothetical protein Bbelb_387420 [Branchiostoma belcheri]|nr:hypothetical protein Bbelb_387420 [Branchiostoma belcheri]